MEPIATQQPEGDGERGRQRQADDGNARDDAARLFLNRRALDPNPGE